MNCDELQSSAKASCYLIRRPRALQWFHNGILYKASEEERQAGRFELFLDLLYVAIVANFSDDLSEHPDGAHLAKYLLIFAPAFHIWSDLREVMNSYYTDDILQRLVILWVMALLILYGNNAPRIDAEEGGLSALRTTVGAYMCARFTTACVFLISSFASHHHRTQARLIFGFMLIGLLICIPLFLKSIPLNAKIGIVAVLIAYQEFTAAFTLSPWLKKKLNLTYSTAMDIAHEIDRMAAFFIIILGEFLYSIVASSPTHIGLTHGYAKAICTLIIAFSLNWLYVSGDGSQAASHPIRRSAWTAFGFFLLHLPLSASFLIGGHMCALSVRLHDFETDGQRWLLTGGLAVGMLCLWLYSQLFRSEDEKYALTCTKQVRVGMRLVVAVVLVVLPATHGHLTSEQFMGLVTGLFALVLVWETVGGLSRDWKLAESWSSEEDVAEEVVDDTVP